ncbi:ThuA domain-containing protein [Flagellimonas olearia]|uniref:Crp/Fnr family transcriptional regulator n=1 Tax=Flagellimonas olearia TaxID=552546 RepID=A0A444VNV9_9FLAO|nr:ThuA domain-containing protein [Allomuricauda olearia]RYC52504.1 Crp/Fnr family transcriptional regulator [Allomuricauda olearia]
MKTLVLSLFAIGFALQISAQDAPNPEEAQNVKMPELVLVFTKTTGYRHASIEKGMKTLRELGRKNGFVALQTDSGTDFNPQNLGNYRLVVFLSTTEEVLDDAQQKAFEGYIKNGGSYLGIHAAADTEYDWPWYGKLVGGYFESHPEQQEAKIDVVDTSHPSTTHLKDVWMHFDEWYNFKQLNPSVSVLMKLDETSYKGGKNGANHPIAWYHEYDGGRAFYTGLGHTDAAYDDPDFRQHLLGAIEWCLKRK